MKPVTGPSEMEGYGITVSLLETLGEETVMALVGLGADVVMAVDPKGIVTRVHVPNRDLAKYRLEEAVGRPLESCVTVESSPKIKAMLSRDVRQRPARGYQVNHALTGESDLPIAYRAFTAEGHERTFVVGRDLRQQMLDQQRLIETQMELEADYRELQDAEARYRTAFKVSAIAHLMVDGERRTILDANSAAAGLFAPAGTPLAGKQIRDLFARRDRDRLTDAIGEARHSASAVLVNVLSTAKDLPVSISIRAYRENGVTNLIFSAWPASDGAETRRQQQDNEPAQDRIAIDDLPEAAVVATLGGQVIAANSPFLDLIHVPSVAQVAGRPLGTWFTRATVDLAVLLSRLAEEGTIRGFPTVLGDNLGGEVGVVLSARLNAETSTVQILVAPVGAPPERQPLQPPRAPEEAEGFAKLVGKVPLKELIRESLDVIEKICIEAALDQTNNNRAYAAELLGLSRQSLYIKLRRHGLEDYRPDSNHSG